MIFLFLVFMISLLHVAMVCVELVLFLLSKSYSFQLISKLNSETTVFHMIIPLL